MSMWNSKKYLTIAALTVGLGVAAAAPASACGLGWGGGYGAVGYGGGWGGAYGYGGGFGGCGAYGAAYGYAAPVTYVAVPVSMGYGGFGGYGGGYGFGGGYGGWGGWGGGYGAVGYGGGGWGGWGGGYGWGCRRHHRAGYGGYTVASRHFRSNYAVAFAPRAHQHFASLHGLKRHLIASVKHNVRFG
jgi:hypothetical protein